MNRSRPRGLSRALLVVALVGSALAATAVPTAANPAPALRRAGQRALPAAAGRVSSPAATTAKAAPLGAFTGDAGGSLLRLQVLGNLSSLIPGLPSAADISAVPIDAKVDSQAAVRSDAKATNVKIGLLGQTIPIQSQEQQAPPDNPTAGGGPLLDVPLSPLANISALEATVHARWPGDQACLPPGAPLSDAKSTVANANVLQLGDTSLLSLTSGSGGTVSSHGTVALVNQNGAATRAVQADSTIQAAPITIAGQIGVDVLSTPELKATAGGLPGSAKIDWTAPVLQIRLPGQSPVVLDAAKTSFSFALPSNPLVSLTLSLGALSNQQAAGDGTHASADGSLLSLSLSLASVKLAQVDLFPMHADATAPVGGVNCPPLENPLAELHKDASAAMVAPGGTFTYTVTVPNRGDTPISNLTVTDQITGPAGFTIVATEPQGSVSGNSITWSGGPDLQPNETRNFTITVKVPPSAPPGSTFTDTATASGTYKGVPVTETVTLPNIPKVGNPPFSDCHLSDSNKAADHLEVRPGETFNYYVHVLNDGQQPCSNVTVTDTLDGKVSFVSCSANCTHSGQTVTWNVGTVQAGSSVTLTVTVQVAANATGSVPNTALVQQPGKPDIPLHTDGPKITTNSVLAPANPPGFGTGVGGVTKGPLAFTGWNAPLWLVAALLAIGSLGALLLRSRRQE